MFEEMSEVFSTEIEKSFTKILKQFTKDYIKTVLELGCTSSMIVIAELAGDEINARFFNLTSNNSLSELAKDYAKTIVEDMTPLPVAVFVASEAWAKAIENFTNISDFADEIKDIKDDTNECLIISGLTCTRKSSSNIYAMIKDSDKIIDLVNVDNGDAESIPLVQFYEVLRDEMENMFRRKDGTKTTSKAN